MPIKTASQKQKLHVVLIVACGLIVFAMCSCSLMPSFLILGFLITGGGSVELHVFCAWSRPRSVALPWHPVTGTRTLEVAEDSAPCKRG